MNSINNVLAAIGNTSMVQLRQITPANGAQIFAKLEWENPTGSMKDRTAQAMLSRAEADGRLKPRATPYSNTPGEAPVYRSRWSRWPKGIAFTL